jgi:hypothetical protein
VRPLNLLSMLAVVIAAAGAFWGASAAQGQEDNSACFGSTEAPVPLGPVGAEGVTLQETLASADAARRYSIQVPTTSTAYVYVGDQWYDLDFGIFSVKDGRDVACWRVRYESISERSQRRVIQFVRPDERVLEKLAAGEYLLTIRAAPGGGFDPSRGFTVRVALGPPSCGLNPPNDEEDPRYPGLKRRRADDQNLYQLNMWYEPEEKDLGPFTLMSFNAMVSPPYMDLFEFDWEVDGQAVPGVNASTIQQAVSDLRKTPNGEHRVRVTARGVREYPDPDPRYRHTPPTLSVECLFRAA